jgi:hypothetical protein
MDRPLLPQLEAWVRQAVAPQGWSDAEVARLVAQVVRVHSRNDRAFLHLYGKGGAGKSTIANKLAQVATDAQQDRVLDLGQAGSKWVHAVFRHACRGRKPGQAHIDLGLDADVLLFPEIKKDMPLTVEQYGAMTRGEPVRLTWASARIPAYVHQALAGVVGAHVYDAAAAGNAGPSSVSATFTLPRVVLLTCNDVPAIDASHLPAAEAAALKATHFEFIRAYA